MGFRKFIEVVVVFDCMHSLSHLALRSLSLVIRSFA